MTVKNILLIDKRVHDYDTIVRATDTELCIPVLFDYYTDTINDIKARILTACCESDAPPSPPPSPTNDATQRCIGLIQHNYNHPFYNLVSADTGSVILGVTNNDPDLASWAPLRDLITWCHTTPEINAAYFDMMACALYSNPDWKYIIDTLTTQTGVIVRASTDDTGSAALGGDWFLETHAGVNLKTVYFTEAIEEYRGVLLSIKYYKLSKSSYDFKGVATGSVIVWGYSTSGGIASTYNPNSNTYTSIASSLTSGVVSIYSTDTAFAALKNNGSVIVWGNSQFGGIASIYDQTSNTYTSVASSLTSGVVSIYSNVNAFAALKNDGTVIAWGNSQYGGVTSEYNHSNNTYTSVSSSLTSGVVSIYSNNYAFVALKNDGTIIVWGNSRYGGVTSSYNPITTTYTSVASSLTSGVVSIYSNVNAFAALKNDGTVIAWGNSQFGGIASSYNPNTATYTSVASGLTSGVVSIYSTNNAFAALKNDGSVIVWGNSQFGGIASIYDWTINTYTSVASSLTSGVVSIYSNVNAFAALKNDGSVILWGYGIYGGHAYIYTYTYNLVIYSETITLISIASSLTSGVVSIYSNYYAFAALKHNGSVITWGDSRYGGNASSFNPNTATYTSVASGLTSGVVSIYSNNYAFAALKNDGSVIVWGNSRYGGIASRYNTNDTYTSVSSSLTSGVVSIYSNAYAFAALKNDGTVIVWGYVDYGGGESTFNANNNTYTSIASSLTSGMIGIQPSTIAFAALKTTETTFDISGSVYTDMDRYNILRNKESRRRFNLTTFNNNVFTLSQATDIRFINPSIPSDKTLRIIVPTYVSSPLSITSTATIPAISNSYIVACDEGEPVTIEGTTYVNYGTYVYRRETNNTFTKLTNTTINGYPYDLYGGDGINSSGIVLYLGLLLVIITNFPSTATKTSVIDASFALVDPSSNSPLAFSYASSNTNVATIAGNVVTILTPGTTTITVSQAQNATYTAGSATMTLTVVPPNYNGLSIPNSNFTGKNLISATFVGTNLANSVFTNAILTSVNFTNATIRGVTTGGLIGTSTATLPSSDYYFKASGSTAGVAGNDAYIIGPYVRITGMDLSNVDISNIPTASFTSLITGSLLYTGSAVLPSGYVFRTGYIVGNGVSLVSADLASQTFANLSMRAVDLSGATLTSATFTNTDLSGASLRNNNLSGLNLSTATLINVASSGLTGGSGGSAVVLPSGYSILSGRIFGPSVNMSSTDLSGLTIPSSQSCASINFSSANLTNTDFSGVNLSNARFTGANLTNANMTNADLTGVTFTSGQAIQLLRNPANASNQTIQNVLNQLQISELRASFPTILADDVIDLSSSVAVFTPSVGTLTANPTVAFYVNISPPVAIGGESATFTMNLQTVGVVNNPTLVTNYPSKTFTISRALVGGVDTTTVTNTVGGTSTVVSNALVRLGNVVYKIHANEGVAAGVPYDINLYKIVSVGLYDVLANSDYLDGRTGVTGPRGTTGTSGNVGATGPTGAASVDGATGPMGITGPTGAVGATGPQGRDGPTGVDGATGITGPVGPEGDAGTESGVGSYGPTGVVGGTGPTGEQGVAGVIASAGPTGFEGATGPTGLSGSLAGLGATGPTGPTGTMNVGVWTVMNPETPEATTGYTNIQYSITPLGEGEGDTRTTTRTTVGVGNGSGNGSGGPALDIRYTMDISGNIKTVGMNSVSDYRIKDNIIDLPSTKTVDGLRPVKYLNTLSGREEYGFLAHEIQATYPEMVVGNKDDTIGYQTIQYDQLFAIFIAEIKRLRDDIVAAETAADAADAADETE